MCLYGHFKIIFISAYGIIVYKRIGHGCALSDPAYLIAVLLLFIGAHGGMPFRARDEARKAIGLTHKERAGISNGKSVELLGTSGGFYRVSVISPREIQKSGIAVLAAVRFPCENYTLKIAGGLHRSLESLAPEMALKGSRLFLLGKDKHVVFALVDAIERASAVGVRLCHKCDAYICIFGVRAGGNGCAVRCPRPRSSVRVAVAHVFGHVSPTVAVVAYGGNHSEARLAVENDLHSHMIHSLFCVAMPTPSAVLDRLEGIGRTVDGDYFCVSLAIKGDLKNSVFLKYFDHIEFSFVNVLFFLQYA